MSAIVIDGGVIHYETIGRGRPILFLHGWLGSWRYWMPTMLALSDKYRTYALDLWGFGDSDKSKERYQVSDYVSLIDNFASKLGIENAPLVGHALGGVVAIEYASQYSERVDKVMAVNLPINSDCINHRLLSFANNSLMARLLGWRPYVVHPEVQQEVEKASDEAIRLSLRSVAQIDIIASLQKIGQLRQFMLLNVYGERDDVVNPGPMRTINGTWPNIRPIGLAEAKHFPMLDEASKFNRLLDDFLEVEDNLSVLELKEEWRRRTR
jgi:pimeloyl-ACP methyl ester carboxylesterase